MKKYAILLSLLMLSTLVHAQYVLKTDLYKQRIRQDTTKEFPEWDSPQEDSTMISITKDSLIIIDNEEKDVYKLESLLTRGAGINEFDGDKWIGIKWLCKDKSGMLSQIVIQKYDSKTFVITITYGNIEYRYQCRPFVHKDNVKTI